ncbi:MAG: transporter substrate-binding domain-containing protein [Pseudobdellovibrionaceae bacterium]|nr:transporter substrate-binding domain-containing protein [Pseudobdellovibrionaceae bacterium]
MDAKKVESIGTNNNDVIDSYLSKAGFSNLKRIEGPLQKIKMLMLGRLALIAAPNLTMTDNLIRYGYSTQDTKQVYVFLKAKLYIAISKSTPERTVRNWEMAFEALKADGTFARIYHKYYPGFEVPRDVE